MNVFLLSAAVFVLFIIIDIFTAKLFKVKRTKMRNISLVLLCVAVAAFGAIGGVSAVNAANHVVKTLYNAYNYLMEGNIELAVKNAEKVDSPHSDVILILSDCRKSNYISALINSDDLRTGGRLNDDLKEQADRIYDLSYKMTDTEGNHLTNDEAYNETTNIIKDCFALLKISETKEVEFISGFKRDQMLNSNNYYNVDGFALSEMLLEAPDDKELLRYSVKYYNAMGSFDSAEENADKLLAIDKSVDNIVLYTDVIAQKFLNNLDISTYDENDSEIGDLLEKAAAAEEVAANFEYDNPRHEENMAQAEKYRQQASAVKVKRIINWLIAQSPLFGDNSGIIDLQMSKLYSACGDNEKASEILMNLIKRKDKISDDSSIKQALETLSIVYNNPHASDDEISDAINMALSSNVFLPDSVLRRSYSQFLNNMLKYERVSIFISRVDAENYPTVRTYLNVNGKKDGANQLANDFTTDNFTFEDNGFAIPKGNIKRITDDTNNTVSIALVIDGSGSMGGYRIENARKAVEACINNMDPETQNLSIVLYENEATLLESLTNDSSVLRAAVNRIGASGGTNISSGLYEGIESLRNAYGTKAIILMTDGEDGAPDLMPAAIETAKKENIAVFTISTGGGEREYMENIASSTGGTYMEAVTDEELVQVYTSLQSYIVNNYCFEYTVENDVESNPRTLTLGLSDYNVSSSRTYSYGGLVLTKDESYIMRSETGSVSLLYAEPSSVSVNDAEAGIPVFINAFGVPDGSKLFINGQEFKDAKIVENTAIAFVLNGKYDPGELNVSVRLPDGTSKSSSKLLSISGYGAGRQVTGKTFILGSSGSTLYSDFVEQVDDYTLRLSGNVTLNGFVRTYQDVTLQTGMPVSIGDGQSVITSGTILGDGAAYVDFASVPDADNYGRIAFGANTVKVLDRFGFFFDEYTISLDYYGATLQLPGFGEVNVNAGFDGKEFTYTADYRETLSELYDNLNYVLNGISLPKDKVNSDTLQMIIGYIPQYYQYDTNYNEGIRVSYDELKITIGKGYANIVGEGTVDGNIGAAEIEDGKISIDTSNIDSMFKITGNVNLDVIKDYVKTEKEAPFEIAAKGLYPDTLTLNSTGLTINAKGLSDCFSNNSLPKSLDAAITVKYPVTVSDEPYRGQIENIVSDISLVCDTLEFVYTDDWTKNGIKVFNSADPQKFVIFTDQGLMASINEIDELSVFGTNLGGEISGTATFTDRDIEFEIAVDGHLDNEFYNVKYDGKANVYFTLPRNFRVGSSYPIEITYGDKELIYSAGATGNIMPEDGFKTYEEDRG